MAFIIPQRLPARPLETAVFAAAGESSSLLVGQWLDPDGVEVGASFEVERPPAQRRETSDGEGNLGFVDVEPPLSIDLDIPLRAGSLTLHSRGIEIDRVAVGELARPAAPSAPERRRFPADAPHATLTVVSERFSESAAFFDAVAGLRDYWRRNFLPFSDARYAEALAIDALFWPADRVAGNFATPDSKIADRMLVGDQHVLERYLRAATIDVESKPFVIVLIASNERAGAGGSAGRLAEHWAPCWITNHAGPREDWEAVAMHELGHAYGLMDEYTDPYVFPLRPYEPNVSPSPDPDRLPKPWKRMLTGHSDPEFTPHLPSDGTNVSAFRGARYSQDYYRPSATCLMRSIGNEAEPVMLCPVCAEVVAEQL